MSNERVVISFETEGIPRTRSEIDGLQNSAIGGFTELNSQFELFKQALSAVQGVASSLYGALIDSNERLNAELLKSQTNLASNLKIYRDGAEIVDITEKITSTQETLRESLKQIEVDTRDLVGVTTDQVNGVFQVLLQNSQKFIGQSKEFSDPIEAATASTKNWAAALGTLGLPLEQANQEIRSILQGDVNNPDSVIAKTLQISREQYDQWVANGELIDRLNDKLEVFAEGNKLAARSVAGVTSNMKSLFEDTARAVGRPLLDPVVDALNAVYKILNDNVKLFESLAKDNITQLVSLMDTLRSVTEKVGESLNIDPKGFLTSGSNLIGNLIVATESLLLLGGELVALVGDDLAYAFENATAVANLTLEGIGKLATLLTKVTAGIGQFVGALDKIPGLKLGEVFGAAQTQVAKLTGEYDQSIEAVQTYASVTDVILAQADKLSKSQGATADSIKGQIDQLQMQKEELKGVKTFREEDAKAVEGQIAAIDKAIVSLEGMSAATSELEFKSQELAEVGTIYEALAAKAEAAQNQINAEGSGDKQVFTESVDALTELTQKQVEYGQISIEQARERLEAVLANNKVEVEQREAVIDTLRSLEEDFSQFKIAQLEQEIEAIDLLAKTGEIGEREGLEQGYAKENQQLQIQIDLLDAQILRLEALGLSTQQLTQEKQGLLQDQLKAQIEYNEELVSLQQEELERSYEDTLRVAEEAEAARTLALTQGLLDRSVSEDEFNQQQLEATKQRLKAELAAEQDNIAALQELANQAETVDQQRDIQDQLNESKLKSTQITQQLLEVELDAQQQIRDSLQKTLDVRKQAIDDQFNQQDLLLRQSLDNEAEYQAEVTRLTVESTQKKLEAEKQAQQELAALGDSEGVEESLRTQTQIKIDLIEAEKRAEESKIDLVLDGVQERIQATEDEFQTRELEIRQSLDNEAEYQSKLAELAVERIQATLETERQAQAELEAIGDTEGVEESKRKQRQLAINLVDAEIKAEKELQNVVADQLNAYRQRLELQKQAANVSLLEEELKLEQAVVAGRITKEQAEIAKLEITRQRVTEELKLLRQLEGQGDEQQQLANQEAIAKAKLQELQITQQINQARDSGNENTLSALDKVTAKFDAQVAKQEEMAASVAHVNQLFDLQAQSVDRVNQLRASQVNLANAQVDVLTTGLNNELSLVEKSLGARQQLNKIEEELANKELPDERRVELLKEQQALKAQLNALGENGEKSEIALIQQKQQIQQQQLQAKQAQLDLDIQQQALLIDQQRASLDLDLVKAQNKAREVQLEAELLQIKAEQLQAEAALTEDVAKRNSLLAQSSALNSQAARTSELAEAQTQAAEQEAEVRGKMIDQQEAINQLQAEAQQDSLDTQQTLLDAQQAYEASIQGFSPTINTRSLNDFSRKLKGIKSEFQEAIKVDSVPLNTEIPVTVQPANLDVRVTDNTLSNSISKLSSSLGSQTSAISSVKSNMSSLGGKLDLIKRAVETNSRGSGTTGVVKPVVNTNVSVNVDKSGNVSVDTQSLLDERASEGGC